MYIHGIFHGTPELLSDTITELQNMANRAESYEDARTLFDAIEYLDEIMDGIEYTDYVEENIR